MSDIYVKNTTGTSSTTWKKALNIFVKTASGTSSAAWSAVKNVYVYFSSGWTRVWPLSGVFSITSPYITTSSGSTTPLYGVDGVRRIGTTVWGKNGTWNPNGWTINSYQYRWRAYSSSDINDLNRASQTALTTYSGAVSLSIPASYDRQYLSFFIQANSSGGSAYNGFAESGTEYGGIQIVRSSPLNLTTSLSSYSPQVGTQITYSSTWDETDRYAAESYRTTIEWYRNLSNSTSGGTYVGSGTTYTPTSSDLNNYLYVVETRYNSGSDYDLGLSTGVQAKIITTSTVVVGLTPPTSVSVASVSRYSDTETLVTLSHSGGSGPYYQLYWTGVQTLPVTPNYDAASNTSSSSISEAFAFANNNTYYFWVRSSSENIPTTFSFGTATAGTYSSYSDITPRPFYTFQSPSGATSSITGSSTTGSTLTLDPSSPTIAAPTATITSIVWRVNDGGTGGNSFTNGSVLQNGGTTFVIPQFLYGSVSSVGYIVRAEVTWNNGVGTQIANSNGVTITAPLTKLATPTGVTASDNRSDGINVTWNTVSGAAYYGVWYGPTPDYNSLADFGGNRNTSLIVHPTNSYLDESMGTGVTRDYYVQAYRSGDPFGTKSEWGGPDSGTKVAAATAPGAPTSLFTSNVSSSGATINWSPPSSDGGSPITRYEVNRDGFAFFNVGNVTQYFYTLSQGTYTIGVRAVNSVGAGPASTISVTIPAPPANLTAPSIFNVVKSGSNYLVYFSGGSGPFYQVWWNRSPTTSTGYDANGSSSPITVTNLTASSGESIYFYVRSVSSSTNTGTGPSTTISSWSSVYTYTEPSATPATAPGTPGTPTNGWTSGTSYPFSWSAPSAGTVTGGGAATITGYTMRIYEATSSAGAGSYIRTTISLGSGTSYTYTSPNAALYYAASVAATNSAGLTGPYSGISQYK